MDESLGVVDDYRDANLRLFALAMLLANKELRTRVEPGDFGVLTLDTVGFARAVDELKSGGNYSSLQRILDEQLGVRWQPSDGLPVDAILKRLKLVSERNEALALITELTRQAMTNAADANIHGFLERLRNATHELTARRE